MIDEETVRELLRVTNGRLFHREGQELEFKEQFNFAGLADYFRDFAAFANNRGGFLIFGIKDSPRVHIGLSKKSLNQFERIDPEAITGNLLKVFSSSIEWSQAIVTIGRKKFGVFRIQEARQKPIITRTDEGPKQTLKNGEIYYRYGGRTQKIESSELEAIINERIKQNNDAWLNRVKSIGESGPENTAVIDTQNSTLSADGKNPIVIDEELARKLNFIQEGKFSERDGSDTLRLVGDVVPIQAVDVVKKIKENLLRKYPYTATAVWKAVKERVPTAKQNEIWKCISDNKIKGDPKYSSYNFASKDHEDFYLENGRLKSITTPVIYNDEAINLITKLLS